MKYENNLRFLRERRGLALKEVEEKTGIGFSELSKIERGERQLTEWVARTLADFYNVSMDVLFKREMKKDSTLKYSDIDLTAEFFLNRLSSYSRDDLLAIRATCDVFIKQKSNVIPLFKEAEELFIPPKPFTFGTQGFSKALHAENITPHILRHYFATECLKAGIDFKVVSGWMGHENILMTMNLYTHSTSDHEEKAVKKMNGFLNDRK